jgi:glycosyltransferase involved in cell wall biosynthesis
MPIRVMYVIAKWGIGGTPSHLLEVWRHLDRRAFTPSLYCFDARCPDSAVQQVRDLDVEMTDGQLRGSSFLGPTFAAFTLRLAREFRRRRIDIVHNYLFDANFVGTLAARLARVPVTLISKRGLDAYAEAYKVRVCRVANALAMRVTVPAEAVRRHVHAEERCPLDKIVVIPNGVDPARVPAAQRCGGTVVGALGRLDPRKGHGDLLEALSLVRARVPAARLVLVGDGTERATLEDRARRLGIVEAVDMRGAVPDGARVLSEMSVFVLPSHVEGMSNALLEAMAAGLPVVATDVGGNPEVVVPGETGLLVRPGDPEALAQAILGLLADPGRARTMGAAGRARVLEHFTVQRMVARHQALYESLLGERRARPSTG